MKSWLRLAILAATTFAGLATVPTRGDDVHLERPRPPVPMTGAERWRLRPTQVAAIVPAAAAAPRKRTATVIPEERRNVRLVYPALVEAR
ncbi:hypothetical protein Q8W71_04160 [Methylobacterium sp. NEAU 140]|uniref:hypothetical protein n=1 Tax=Methylobacterium sp. NEAU 140 TaxID=3064945 RepID=UPI002735CECF|nr:hypothetical protein [Methylobacterium sp. NEAU 140]MDP4021811.1 hypothetical protein [Methylobacterium sp. NEAU 140]